jgi:phage terminase small subunit
MPTPQDDNSHGLTDQQRVFVRELMIDWNATAAYQRAGYTANYDTARVESSRLLAKPNIQAELRDLVEARLERLDIDADKVLREVQRIAFSDIGDILDFTGDAVRMRSARQIPLRARRAIASIKGKRTRVRGTDPPQEVEVIEFKLWNKLAALVKLMRHLGFLDLTPGGGDRGRVIDPRSLTDEQLMRIILAERGLPNWDGHDPVRP